MASYRISKSTASPVPVEDIKAHLRIDSTSTSEDVLIKSYALAALDYAENLCGRDFTTAKRMLLLDEFPERGVIYLDHPPVAGIESIVYTNTTGGVATAAATVYDCDTYAEPARLTTAYDAEWPETRDVMNAVKVSYSCGYSTTPEAVKSWIKIRVGAMYENREGMTDGRVQPLGRSFVDGLLDPYVIKEL